MRDGGMAVFVVLVGLWAPSLVAAQGGDWLDVGVGLVGEATALTPGVTVEVDLDTRAVGLGPVPWLAEAAVEADLPLTLDPARNPESLTLDAGYRVLSLIEKLPPDDDPLAAPRRYGYWTLGLALKAEALQQLNDADVAAGFTLGYGHTRDELWFLPGTAVAALGYVGCVGCAVPDDESAGAWRLDLGAEWSIPVGDVLPGPLAPLRLRPAGRFFRTWGMDPAVAAVREGRGAWGSVELAYAIDGVEWLHELHVGWRGGELPVRLRDESAWDVGATVVW